MHNRKIPTILIHNSEKKAGKFLEMLAKVPDFLVLGFTTSGTEGVEMILNLLPKIVFINLKTSDIDGFEVVKTIQNKYVYPEICFLSENDSEAFYSMQYRPLDFIVEPVRKNDIEDMLLRSKQKLRKKELLKKMEHFSREHAVTEKKILQIKGGIILVNPSEVVFCKAEQTNTTLFFQKGENQRVKTGLLETVETLNNPDIIKVSRSYYINQRFLRKIERKRNKCALYFDGKTWEVPASKIAIDLLEEWNISNIY